MDSESMKKYREDYESGDHDGGDVCEEAYESSIEGRIKMVETSMIITSAIIVFSTYPAFWIVFGVGFGWYVFPNAIFAVLWMTFFFSILDDYSKERSELKEGLEGISEGCDTEEHC